VVAQKGARENFLAARVFHRRAMLAALIVDWYAPFSGRVGKTLAGSTQGAIARAFRRPTDELPRHLIKALYGARLRSQMRSWFSRPKSLGDQFLRSDQDFARSAARQRLPEHDVFFGYSYACLELLEAERVAGKFCVLDQIDPGEKEHEIIIDEQKQWPGYVKCASEVCGPYFERLRREWELAHVIVVNSEWARDCIVAKGAPPEKMEVLPLAYEAAECELPRQSIAGQRAQILWVGRVTLQKGIQYLLEAARLLQNEAVEFVICGEAEISPRAQAEAPPNVRWLGKVTHAQKIRLFSSATAFVLPTLSDGFGLTQLEALAQGLPVITTPNCGRAVEDGATGFVIPARDPNALAEAIRKFARQPALALEMAPRCREAARGFSMAAYGRRLMEIIERRAADCGLTAAKGLNGKSTWPGPKNQTECKSP
jgi:glycosyltransferase involved in cell wall biosynthesis